MNTLATSRPTATLATLLGFGGCPTAFARSRARSTLVGGSGDAPRSNSCCATVMRGEGEVPGFFAAAVARVAR